MPHQIVTSENPTDEANLLGRLRRVARASGFDVQKGRGKVTFRLSAVEACRAIRAAAENGTAAADDESASGGMGCGEVEAATSCNDITFVAKSASETQVRTA